MILSAFDESRRSIDAAIYTFTSFAIADALVKAKRRGVNVRVIVDGDFGRTARTRMEWLKRNGIEICYENNPGGIMHNKYAIIDDSIVITGSYNWTEAANSSNYENLLIVRSKGAAQLFKENFEKMWKEFQ